MADKWSDPTTILALVKLGADLTPTIVSIFRKESVDKKNLEPATLEGLLALGYSLDEATLILAEEMRQQP